MKENDNRNPLVTIIMPTYNHEKYIGNAIDSVLAQNYNNYELIIIDNYSQDATEEIVNSYSDYKIKYHKFNNQGIIAASRNYGIRRASGKYIAFLDSDDIWLSKKLEKQVSLMETDEETALSYVLFTKLYRDKIVKGKYPDPRRRLRGYIFQELYLLNFIANSSAMVRSSVLNEVGLLDEDPKLVGVEDADLWLRISKIKKVNFVEEDILLLYRVGGNNVYYRKIYEKIAKRLYIAKKYSDRAGNKCFAKKILLIPLYCFMRKLITEPFEKPHQFLSLKN